MGAAMDRELTALTGYGNFLDLAIGAATCVGVRNICLYVAMAFRVRIEWRNDGAKCRKKRERSATVRAR